MKLHHALTAILLITVLASCIKDDFVNDTVDPVLRIVSIVDTLEVGTSFQLEYMYLNNVGAEESVDVEWLSSSPEILDVDENGLVTALAEGSSWISTRYTNQDIMVTDSIRITTGESTVITFQSTMGVIATTSSYVLEGGFTLTETETGLNLSFEDDYRASTSLPGLYVYLSNNKNSINTAYEIGAVQVFEGSHSYDIPDVGFNDYAFIVYFCEPFNVKVGDGTL